MLSLGVHKLVLLVFINAGHLGEGLATLLEIHFGLYLLLRQAEEAQPDIKLGLGVPGLVLLLLIDARRLLESLAALLEICF